MDGRDAVYIRTAGLAGGKYPPSMVSDHEKQQEGRSDEYKNAESRVQKAV